MLATASAMALLVPASAHAAIVISQSASPATVAMGGLVTVTVTERNDGPALANPDVEMFPLTSSGGKAANDSYESVTPSQGTCELSMTGAYHTVRCHFGAYLQPGGELHVVAVLRLNQTMRHNVWPAQLGETAPSELGVGVSAPPLVTGSPLVKLRGLPRGCATGNFTLTVNAAVADASSIETRLNLGLRSNGFVLEWHRAASGRRMRVTVPVAQIMRPAVGTKYLLHVYVHRRGGATLSRTAALELCSD